jgi:transcriptional regulator with XRE-family HTH domain
MTVTNLRDFQSKVHHYRQLAGKSQKELAEAVKLHPNVLSGKLNGTGRTGLNHPEIKKIIKTLIVWGAITHQTQVIELLELMNLKTTAFSPEEWGSPPLNQLRSLATVPDNTTATNGFSTLSFTGFESNVLPGRARILPGFPWLEKAQSEVSLNREKEDWDEAPDVTNFCGRKKELSEVEGWLVTEPCRVITVLGMGGIGKTVFATRLGEETKRHFDFVLWRSLEDAPPLNDLLAEYIYFVAGKLPDELPASTERQLALFLSLLRQYRCLLILDKAENLLEWGNHLGQYRAGYEGYGRFFQRLGESTHQSCLLLTSQENLKELIPLEGKDQLIRAFRLKGLGLVECQKLLKAKELYGTNDTWSKLVECYSGHPLALKLIAEPIHTLFGGNIAAFLSESEKIFGDLRKLLDLQFTRLSRLEQEIMFRITVEYNPFTPVNLLGTWLPSAATRNEMVEALIALWRRSLLEQEEEDGYFRLPSLLVEYMSARLINQVCEEIVSNKPVVLINQPLFRHSAKGAEQYYQIRPILGSILTRLHTIYKSEEAVEKQLSELLATYKKRSCEQDYLKDNLTQLLLLTKETLID